MHSTTALQLRKTLKYCSGLVDHYILKLGNLSLQSVGLILLTDRPLGFYWLSNHRKNKYFTLRALKLSISIKESN